VNADSVYEKQGQRIQNALFEFGDFENVSESAANHVQITSIFPPAASIFCLALSLILLIRTVTGTVTSPFPNFNTISIAFDEAAFDQRHFIDDRLGLKTIQILTLMMAKIFLKWFLNPRFGRRR
jgi:hypothetical protein